MLKRLPVGVWIGCAMILAGIAWFGTWAWWDSTSIWAPPFVPISTEPLVPVLAGIFVIVRSFTERRRELRAALANVHSLTRVGPLPQDLLINPRSAPARIAPDLPPGSTPCHVRWKGRPSPRPDFSAIRLAGVVWLPLVPLMFAFTGSFFLHPKGLPVRLVRPGIPALNEPWTETLRVLVEPDKTHKRLNLYLNSQPIAWEDLGPLLKKQLLHRPPHTFVYVEGDPYLLWGSVAKAIDEVRGAGAEAVLYTTKSGTPLKR